MKARIIEFWGIGIPLTSSGTPPCEHPLATYKRNIFWQIGVDLPLDTNENKQKRSIFDARVIL
jgi:hypothetical protein